MLTECSYGITLPRQSYEELLKYLSTPYFAEDYAITPLENGHVKCRILTHNGFTDWEGDVKHITRLIANDLMRLYDGVTIKTVYPHVCVLGGK